MTASRKRVPLTAPSPIFVADPAAEPAEAPQLQQQPLPLTPAPPVSAQPAAVQVVVALPSLAPPTPTRKATFSLRLEQWEAIDDEAVRRRRLRGGPLQHSDVLQEIVDLWIAARKQAPRG